MGTSELNNSAIPNRGYAMDLNTSQCEVIMVKDWQDVRCTRLALSWGHCKRHGGETPVPELITHRESKP